MNDQPSDTNKIKKLMTIISYAWQNQKIPIALALIVILFVFMNFLNDWHLPEALKTHWSSDLDQVVSIATLMVAVLVWFTEIQESWKKGLPKRLTVYFDFIPPGKTQAVTVMKCIKAHLSDVADSRQLGQQIGLQMCGENLSFRAPFIKQSDSQLIFDPDPKVGFILHYEITFMLTKLPANICMTKCKTWRSPFDQADLQCER